MTKERWVEIMNSDDSLITQEEFALGWHYCPEWDDLVVGPGMSELHCCTCDCARHVPRPPEEPVDPNFVY